MADPAAVSGDNAPAEKTPRRGRGRPKTPAGPKDERFGLRARAEWLGWLQDSADAMRLERPQVIDQALALWAERVGRPLPPKR